MTAKLRDFVVQTTAGKPCRDTRSKSGQDAGLTPHRIPKNLANLFFGASPMASRTTLQFLFDVIVELANQDLPHAEMIA